MRTWLRTAIALALCALLLIYVVDVNAVAQTVARGDPVWVLAALAAFLLDRVVMSFKWGLLLAIRGYHVTLTQRLMVYCSAMMWGLALPSTVGADGIRVLLVRRFGVRVDDALATILVERGIGFISALLTGLLGVIVLRAMLPDAMAYDYVLLVGAALLAGAIAIVTFSFNSHALSAVLRLLPARFAHSKPAQLLSRLHGAYRALAYDRRRLSHFSVLTFLEQLIVVACYGLVAVALQVQFDMLFLFAAVPLAILISRLPISIDGIGVYEGIFIGVMALGGVSPADALAVSLAARALQILVWLPWWLALAARTGTVRPPTQPAPTSSPQAASSRATD
jgi:glycosyltransferase 2 family protein